jgi:hypothetical protein
MHESLDQPDSAPIDTMDPVDGCDEVEQIAMTLSRELHAPWQLRERVRADLHAIRTSWIDSVPQVAFEFSRLVSLISVEVDSTIASAIQDGSYTAWDSLNELYSFDSIQTCDYLPPGHFAMHFTDCQNPVPMALAYRELDGFAYVSTVFSWYRGMDQLFVTEVADTLFYIFSEDFADSVFECHVVGGCGGYAYDLFSTIGADIEYHGHLGSYGAAGLPESPPEPWHSRIRDAWDLWAGSDAWPPPPNGSADSDGLRQEAIAPYYIGGAR